MSITCRSWLVFPQTSPGMLFLVRLLLELLLVENIEATAAASSRQIVTLQTFYPGPSAISCKKFEEESLERYQQLPRTSYHLKSQFLLWRTLPAEFDYYSRQLSLDFYDVDQGAEMCLFLDPYVHDSATLHLYAKSALEIHDNFLMNYACRGSNHESGNPWKWPAAPTLWRWDTTDDAIPLKYDYTKNEELLGSWKSELQLMVALTILQRPPDENVGINLWKIIEYVPDSGEDGVAAPVPLVHMYRDSDSNCKVILAIRGTSNKFEWSLNFMSGLVAIAPAIGDPEPGKDEISRKPSRIPMAHEGYVLIADSILPAINRLLKANIASCQKWKQRTQILIGGHSLGGAMANLLGLRLAIMLRQQAEVVVVSFGAPNVFNWAARELFREHVHNAINVVSTLDPIPSLPCSPRKCSRTQPIPDGNRLSHTDWSSAEDSLSNSVSSNNTPQVQVVTPFGYHLTNFQGLTAWYHRSVRVPTTAKPSVFDRRQTADFNPGTTRSFDGLRSNSDDEVDTCYVSNAAILKVSVYKTLRRETHVSEYSFSKEPSPRHFSGNMSLVHSCTYICASIIETPWGYWSDEGELCGSCIARFQ